MTVYIVILTIISYIVGYGLAIYFTYECFDRSNDFAISNRLTDLAYYVGLLKIRFDNNMNNVEYNKIFNTQWSSFLNLYNVFVTLYKRHMIARSIFCYNMMWLFVVVPTAVYGVLGRQIRQINQLVGRFLMGVFSNTNLWYEIGAVVIIASLVISIIIYLKNYRRTKQLYIKLNQQANDLLDELDKIDNK